ncbi:unnamed protein product [Phytophthora fragariaefolia]|uniref:Unnamed protein product n=1 Tax=Phytophthora fragariaefolia TaxID=1490495 RepID=A0A9W6U4W3_9STRA|nr:unnamed protein product [Phytophthora fragariaefolia]
MPSSAGSIASVAVSPGEDVAPDDCRVCALGIRPPPDPPPLDIKIPSVDDPPASVASILVDAHGLEHEAATLHARFELAAAYNAGLAAHASVLHDRNRALAHEGFELDARTVNRLHEQVEALGRENTRLEDEAAVPIIWRPGAESRNRRLPITSTGYNTSWLRRARRTPDCRRG